MEFKKTCQECNKEYKTTSSKSLFCGSKCRNNWYYKNIPKYKRMRKAYSKEHGAVYYKKNKKKIQKYHTNWRKENREHFNSLVREPSRIYQEKIREERRKKKLCICCGKNPVDEKEDCNKCRKRHNLLQRNRYWKAKELNQAMENSK